MTKTLKLNTALFFALLLISGFAVYHQLGDFAHLKNADGVLTDMRSMVLWDIRFPRIGLALLTGASLAIAGNAMQGIFQNPLASPGYSAVVLAQRLLAYLSFIILPCHFHCS